KHPSDFLHNAYCWALGAQPPTLIHGPTHPATQQFMKHEGVNAARQQALRQIRQRCSKAPFSRPTPFAGSSWYSTPSENIVTRDPAALLATVLGCPPAEMDVWLAGSYGVRYGVSNIDCCTCKATIRFTAWNRWTV